MFIKTEQGGILKNKRMKDVGHDDKTSDTLYEYEFEVLFDGGKQKEYVVDEKTYDSKKLGERVTTDKFTWDDVNQAGLLGFFYFASSVLCVGIIALPIIWLAVIFFEWLTNSENDEKKIEIPIIKKIKKIKNKINKIGEVKKEKPNPTLENMKNNKRSVIDI